MERQRYCVYNQTCECFLSLGVIAADPIQAHLKGASGRRAFKYDDGLWVTPAKEFHTFLAGMTSPLDLVYLDSDYRVVHVVESFPGLRVDSSRIEAASVLALPAHTIYSSQTQPGNQLVICVAEEMESCLRSAPSQDGSDGIGDLEPDAACANIAESNLPEGVSLDRRKIRRRLWPRLVAYDRNGDNLMAYGVRDANPTGLYLLTKKRWPLGSLVTMTLRKADGGDEDSALSITLQMKVVRWGKDGVGLEFTLPDALESTHWIAAEGSEELAEVTMLDG